MKVVKEEVTMDYSSDGIIVIPAGTETSHKTAMGIDASYNFVSNYDWYKPHLVGFAREMATHDMVHYGINLSAEQVQDIDEFYKRILVKSLIAFSLPSNKLEVAKMWNGLSKTNQEGFWRYYNELSGHKDKEELKEGIAMLQEVLNG